MKRNAPHSPARGTSLNTRLLTRLASNGSGTNEEQIPYNDSSGPRVETFNDIKPSINLTLGHILPAVLIHIIILYDDKQLHHKVIIERGIDLNSIPLYMAPVLVRGEAMPVPTLGDGRAGCPLLLTSVLRLRGCWQPSPALLEFFYSPASFPVGSRVFQSATNEDMQIRQFRVGETIELTTKNDGPMFSCPLSAMWHWGEGAGRKNGYKSATSKRAYNNYHSPLARRKLLVRGMRSENQCVRLHDTPYDTIFVHEFTESPTDMKPSHMYNKGVDVFYEAFRRGVGQVNSAHTYSCVVKWVGIIDACFAGTADCPLTSFGSTDYFRLVVLTSSVKKC
jgi:hypothetical protein